MYMYVYRSLGIFRSTLDLEWISRDADEFVDHLMDYDDWVLNLRLFCEIDAR